MSNDIARVLVTEEEIDAITTRIAKEIDRDYATEDKRLILVCILKGSIVFMGDLMKKITVPVEIDCMKVSSYGAGTSTTGSVNIHLDLMRPDLDKCDLLIIEDIIDSGFTMREVFKLLSERQPKTLKLASCLSKPSRRECEIDIDYLGFEIPDKFVIGYGLDYAEKYRNLPYLGYIEAE